MCLWAPDAQTPAGGCPVKGILASDGHLDKASGNVSSTLVVSRSRTKALSPQGLLPLSNVRIHRSLLPELSFQKSCGAAVFISPLTGICGVAAGCPGWGSQGSQRPGLLPRAHRPGGSAALLLGTFVSPNGLTHLLTLVFFQVRLQKDSSAAASLWCFRDDSH